MKNSEKQARYRMRRKGIEPSHADMEKVDTQHGKLPRNASIEQQAERFRLYQAQALIRLYENGQLPLEQMRAMDAIAHRPR